MNHSEVEDDPEPFESSEEEWGEDEEEKKSTKKRGRPVRKAATKKAKKVEEVVEDEEEEDDEDIEQEEDEDDSDSESESGKKKKPNSKNGVTKKSKGSSDSSQTNSPTPSSGGGKKASKIVYSNNYAIGSFVIAKKDAQMGDTEKKPWIWRIDGKSLLQKYEPFEHEGKTRHKNTSIYTGWSPMDIDEYAPVTIDLIEQSSGQVIVELHWDELKKIVHDESE